MSEARIEDAPNSEPREPFKVDTETIPEGVDRDFAATVEAIINLYRDGHSDRDEVQAELLGLYWDTQDFTDEPTSDFLWDAVTKFPVESGMTPHRAAEIYTESLGKFDDEGARE